MIAIGTSVGKGMTVAEPFDNYDHPDAWWISCGRGHRIFATNALIEAGTVTCTECASEAKQYAARQERSKLADDLIAAGRENDQDFEDLIAAERKENL
jgi:hypothetical protein